MQTVKRIKCIPFESIPSIEGNIKCKEGIEVKTFDELQDIIAKLSCLYKDYVLFFRGQDRDYGTKNGASQLFPSFFRGTFSSTTISKRWALLERATNELKKELTKCGSMIGISQVKKKEILQWAILQHYKVVDTPLLDVTQSLRVACSFAAQNNNNDEQYGYVYVLALPYPTNRITINSEEYLSIIRLISILPSEAKRPLYQEGYLLGDDVIPRFEIDKPVFDFTRRLIAKFRIRKDSKVFWDNVNTIIPEDRLLPKEDDFLSICDRIKKSIYP
jgi:hypothetical protein